MRTYFLFIAALLIVTGIVGIGYLVYLESNSGYVPVGPGQYPMDPYQGDYIPGQDQVTDFESNGEMIYYTGFNDSGHRLSMTAGPNWIHVHGGSCVNCHGEDGKGGVPIMMGYVVPADITYESLTSEEHAGHIPYTDETIKIAIREGIDPEGHPLDSTMPRWRMMDEDMDDLIEYLKTL
jgi:mono/diheme cytochrome c family protein